MAKCWVCCGVFALIVGLSIPLVYQLYQTSHWAEKRWDRCSSLGIPYLLAKRSWLRANAVFEAPTIDNTKRYPLPQEPGKNGYKHRVTTGHYNAPENKFMGAVGQPLGRNANISGMPRVNLDINDPSPTKVAEALLHRKKNFDDPTLSTDIANLWAAAWIQFMIHDWVPAHLLDKTSFLKVDGKDMLFTTEQTSENDGIPAYSNKAPHWWMGSQIYGISLEQEKSLRSLSDGKMRVTKNYMPLDPDTNLELVGAGSPNLWFGLTMLHYIFLLEHNQICDMLKEKNPSWDDERLFQTARLINTAQIAKIHTIDWTTTVIQHPTGRFGQHTLWSGFLGSLLPSVAENRGSLGPLNSAIIWGIPGSERETQGVNFAHTEEFVSVYRFHALLPDVFKLVSHKGEHKKIKDVKAEDFIMGKSHVLNTEHQVDTLYSLGVHRVGQLSLHNYPKFLTNLKVPALKAAIDMSVVDVVRDRERKTPRFNDVRRALGLEPMTSWEQLTKNEEDIKTLKDVYGKDGIEKVDLIVGTLAESKVAGYLFSPTIYALFTVQTQRRLETDRFFTDDYTEEVYTKEGIAWVESSTFRDVLLRHWSAELSSFLPEGKNAFMPWDRETKPVYEDVYGDLLKTFVSYDCFFGEVDY